MILASASRIHMHGKQTSTHLKAYIRIHEYAHHPFIILFIASSNTYEKTYSHLFIPVYIINFLYTWSSDGNTSFHPKKHPHHINQLTNIPHPHIQPRDPWCRNFLGQPKVRRPVVISVRRLAAVPPGRGPLSTQHIVEWCPGEPVEWRIPQGYALTQINEFLQRMEFFNGESTSTMDQEYYYGSFGLQTLAEIEII